MDRPSPHTREGKRLINRRRQGDLGEASAIEWLTRHGATVWMPLGHSPDADLIADVDGHLLSIQVKTSTYVELTPNGHCRYQVQLATNGGNQSWTGIAKRFDPSRFDFLFVLTGDGHRWFIPAAAIAGTTAINVGGPKYSEYEIEPGRAIDELVHRPIAASVESESHRGSADVGESGETVNLVPRLLSGFESHLPHQPESPAGPSARTRVSANHQITIPLKPFQSAGLEVGQAIRVTAAGSGRLLLDRIETQSID